MLKRYIAIVLCYFLMMHGTAYAHRPRRVIADYDKSEGRVSVVIKHRVRNPEKHFIKAVIVKRNGSEIASREFTEQESEDFQTAVFDITNIEEGDILKVIAVCNISGETEENVELE